MPDVVLVTGGSGLVGKGIEHIISTEPEGSRFGKRPGETWIFARSSEGDLRSVFSLFPFDHVLTAIDRDPEQTRRLYEKYKPTHVIHLAALGMLCDVHKISLSNKFCMYSGRAVQEHEIQGTLIPS